MVQMLEANWIAVLAVVALVFLVAWLVWGRRKPARVQREYRDVLSEGAGPAQRNNALIDTPPAAAIPPITTIAPPPGAGLMAGVGEIVSEAAEQEIEAAVAPEPAPAPAASPAEPVAPAASAQGDDLKRIKGVGPKLSTLLGQLGVTTFAQIANWTEADLAAIDAKLGAFAGRPTRDAWIEQAKLLAGGDTAGYEAKFGKL
ncbi:hypothetical protein OLX02_06645 [Novosphingobium sp. KCTC 2891]|uniref:hypothetical protein n=1 Tax=Novosphingobium sp. KCTC 2891 TaxID=2989730 RepID=UPI0022221530|nr:hypothetical protein [Novosphingobium sp. KCTC 2891]MCW1382496.1 hypothetical protein [Novosphingobium sp. KCTC 2891]